MVLNPFWGVHSAGDVRGNGTENVLEPPQLSRVSLTAFCQSWGCCRLHLTGQKPSQAGSCGCWPRLGPGSADVLKAKDTEFCSSEGPPHYTSTGSQTVSLPSG